MVKKFYKFGNSYFIISNIEDFKVYEVDGIFCIFWVNSGKLEMLLDYEKVIILEY